MQAVALTDHDSLAGIGRGRRPGRPSSASPWSPGARSPASVGTGGCTCWSTSSRTDGSPLGEELVRLRARPPATATWPLAERLAGLGVPDHLRRWWWPRPGARRASGRPHFAAAMVGGRGGRVGRRRLRPVPGQRPPGLRAQGPADRGRRGRPGPRRRAGWPSSPTRSAAASSRGRAGPAWSASWPRPASPASRPSTGATRRASAHELGNLARRFGLVATGGSDHHGASSPTCGSAPGTATCKVPDRVLDQLEARRPDA